LLAIALAGLVAGTLLIFSGVRNAADLNAYRSAAECSSPSDAVAGGCRYSGVATVTASQRQSKLSVDLRFEDLPGRSFTAQFATDREPLEVSTATGSSVTCELWNGKVTKFDGVGTVDDPDYFAANNLIPGVIFFVVSLVATYWGIGFVRLAWRLPSAPGAAR